MALMKVLEHQRTINDRGEDSGGESDKFFPIQPTVVSRETPDEEIVCGVGFWRPKCLQRLATPSVFTVIFFASMVFLGMPNSYFYAITSTIEKTFNVNSKVTGIVLIGNDVSQVLFSVVIGYLGSKGSRPVWMACGLAAVSASYFLYASNHYFWEGPSSSALLLGGGHFNQTMSSSLSQSADLCRAANKTFSTEFETTIKAASKACPIEKPINYLPVWRFFLGQFVAGIGNTALVSLGISYGDDHIKKKYTPLFFTSFMMSRMLGSFLGFLIAGYFLSIYIVPGVNPHMSKHDPRWLGAWWLGFIVFGCCTTVCSLLMFHFPKKLPPRYQRAPAKDELKALEANQDKKEDADLTKITLKDFLKTVVRLLRNTIFVCTVLAESVLLLYIGGSQIYSSRYLEVQFRQTASKASVLTGLFGICIMTFACAAGSLLFTKFRPSARRISGINTTLRFVQVLLMVGQMTLSCGRVNYENVVIRNERFEVNSSCSKNCDCSETFQPVCIGNATFLSPCLAGCTRYHSSGTQKSFYNCACSSFAMTDNNNMDYHWNNDSNSRFSIAKPGICPSATCSATFKVYLALMSVINILTAALYPASSVIALRSVGKADKSMALALKMVGASLIGFFPGPIIYGAVFDSACLLRESEKCTGGKGNCWVYNVDLLRYRFIGTSAAVISISAMLTLLLYMQVRKHNIILFDHDEDEDNKENHKVDNELKPMNE